ncbi:hypothetical protein [Gluconacetobacter tumulicola]|uniref:Uncharacterized protein n=1 Tax=Gluconacetobacter tumulicola TaxID=1017177 RepID=A0A7W4JAJ5_9PROT|nr:hypothetical protein [Gluconacetobacter tumulicola]MBB2177700.1 hypothetical protein [Gluconacetobacter tumulicola]
MSRHVWNLGTVPRKTPVSFSTRSAALFPKTGNELVLPLDEALAAENPNVLAALSPQQEIRFQATASVDRFPATRFTGRDARAWLSTA